MRKNITTTGALMKTLKRCRDKSILGLANPRCYARAMKDCCVQMSGEHPLPRSVLRRVDQELGIESPTVDIRNMAFQPTKTVQKRGIGGLESKIVCKHHNTGLAGYDAEALTGFDGFERMHYAAAGQLVPEPAYSIDGDRFERFLLKALCGGLYSGIFPVEEVRWAKDIQPPLEWLEILYRGKAFPAGFGLYFTSPEVAPDATIIKWSPLMLQTPGMITVHGLRFWLFGMYVTLLAPGPEPRAIDALDGQRYRPEGITVAGSRTRIDFRWKSGPQCPGIVLGLT
jgi:hypothetical protein